MDQEEECPFNNRQSTGGPSNEGQFTAASPSVQSASSNTADHTQRDRQTLSQAGSTLRFCARSRSLSASADDDGAAS